MPNAPVHQPAVPEPAGGDPNEQVPRAEGLGHDGHPVPDARSSRRRHDLEGLLRPRDRRSTPARSSSSTRRATSSSSPLKMLGYSVNTDDPGELDEARKILHGLSPRTSSRSTRTPTRTSWHEEAVLAWAGPAARRLRATHGDGRHEVHRPEEGTLFWLDTWVMIADAPHPNAAYAWLDFIQDPDDPGQGDGTPATPRRTTRRRSSSPRRSSNNPPSSCRRTSWPTSRAPDEHSRQPTRARHLGRVQVEHRRLTRRADRMAGRTA